MHDILTWTSSFFFRHPPLTLLLISLPKFVLGVGVSILFHEMGHVIAGEFTPMPASSICMGRYSFGYAWVWPNKQRWGFLKGKFALVRPAWRTYPHVYSMPYPSTGWIRIVKSVGGPIGSALCAVLLILYVRYIAPFPWHREHLFHVVVTLEDDAFFMGILYMSWVGTFNIVPRRGETAMLKLLYRCFPVRIVRIERWLDKRAKSRMVSDGDKIWSALVRSRRGRRWRWMARP